MKHTPGPWILQENGPAINIRRLDATHHMILLNMNCILRDEFEANAHLIAAAPQLLEACKELYEMLRHIISHDPCFADGTLGSAVLPPLFEKAQAAIAAAEGEP